MIRLFLLGTIVSLVGCKSMAREEVSEVQLITMLAKRLANYDKTLSVLTQRSKKAQEELLYAKQQLRRTGEASDAATSDYEETFDKVYDYYYTRLVSETEADSQEFFNRIMIRSREIAGDDEKVVKASEIKQAKIKEHHEMVEIYEQKKSYSETISSQIRDVERDVEETVYVLGSTAAATVVGGALSAATLATLCAFKIRVCKDKEKKEKEEQN